MKSNNLTLRQMRAFRAVAAEGGFGAAAERLHLTPAALSALVKEAEAQLGVRLFDRNTRRVQLSAIGAEFLPLVERVLQDLDEAVASITHLKELRRGIVRLAAPEVLSCTLVPRAMAAFRARHPQVEVRFLDVPIEDVIARTLSGEIDLGLGASPVSDPGIVSTPFTRAPLMIAVRRDDPLAARRSVGWSQLRDRSFVTYFRRPHEWMPRQPAGDVDLPADIIVVRRLNTALAMVQAGSGITACPVYARELAAGFGLKLLPMSGPKVEREYAVLTRPGHSLAPQVEAFRAFLVEFAATWSAGVLAGDGGGRAREVPVRPVTRASAGRV